MFPPMLQYSMRGNSRANRTSPLFSDGAMFYFFIPKSSCIPRRTASPFVILCSEQY
nr:MAG TPA: hypothetical protein [Caudoviricetes sp.]DAL57296.1 MAG TPA_asm: hypothetical protein [Caudoviricetes sp.]